MKNYLVKFTIPSIQEIIIQSRKLLDLYGSSSLIPRVLSKTFKSYINNQNIEFLIPTKDVIEKYPNNITNVSYFIYSCQSEEEIKNLCEEIEKNFYENLIEKLYKPLEKEDIQDYEKLILYQIKNSINVVYAAVELKNNLQEAKKDVDKLVAYIKGTKQPDTTSIEGINLYEKENNLYFEENFLEFLDNQKNLGYIHVLGAYRCSVCGKRSIIGAKLEDIKGNEFWKKFQNKKSPLIGENERLCGFCLGKRIYNQTKFKSVVDYAIKDYDVEIEKRILEIVKKNNIKDIQDIYEENWDDISGNAKQELNKIYDKYGKPNKYYAFLIADGDNMGEKVEKAFESTEKIKDFTKKLSEYGKEFKEITKNNRGETIYTGGDDILAITPKSKSLKLFKEIYDEFKNVSTMSGGIIIAHYKIPLNYVLAQLRQAEEIAKSKGKEGVYIKYIKHSYSSSGCFLKRNEIENFENLIGILAQDDFPNTFINQLEVLLKPYLEIETLNEETKVIKPLIKYLINKKKFNKKEDFESLIFNEVEKIRNIKEIIEKLKVAKFLATRSER